METTDKQFFLTMLGVTGVLVLLAVLVLIAANLLSWQDGEPRKSAAQIKIAKERIQPIGQVSLKSDPVQSVASDSTTIVAVADNTASQSLAAEKDEGAQAYSGLCQSCHDSGAAGAPIVGDITAWKARIDQGIDVLYQSVINGKGLMAPRGGNPSMSDDDIKAAVDYMVKLSQ